MRYMLLIYLDEKGLDEAERVGFNPIKVNAVAMRDFTEEELLEFACLARERPF